MYFYKQTEFGEYPLWTVGITDGGEWEPESDHMSKDAAAKRVRYLNGGIPTHGDELLEALEGLIRLKKLIEYPREVSEAHVGEAMAVSNAIRKAEEAIAKAKGL